MSPPIAIIVDQDETFRARVRALMIELGFEVHGASPDTLLADIRNRRPHLIWVEVENPDRLGFALCGQIRALARNTPLVMASGTLPRDEMELHQKLKAHADLYLAKAELDDGQLRRAILRFADRFPHASSASMVGSPPDVARVASYFGQQRSDDLPSTGDASPRPSEVSEPRPSSTASSQRIPGPKSKDRRLDGLSLRRLRADRASDRRRRRVLEDENERLTRELVQAKTRLADLEERLEVLSDAEDLRRKELFGRANDLDRMDRRLRKLLDEHAPFKSWLEKTQRGHYHLMKVIERTQDEVSAWQERLNEVQSSHEQRELAWEEERQELQRRLLDGEAQLDELRAEQDEQLERQEKRHRDEVTEIGRLFAADIAERDERLAELTGGNGPQVSDAPTVADGAEAGDDSAPASPRDDDKGDGVIAFVMPNKSSG